MVSENWGKHPDRRAEPVRWERDAHVARDHRHIAEPVTRARRDLLEREAGGLAGPGGLGPEDCDLLLFLVLGPLLAVAGLLLASGHLSTFLVSGGWPRYDLADAPGIVGRVATRPGDPAAAWAPVNRGVSPPGAAAWWATFLVLIGLVVALAIGLRALLGRGLGTRRGGVPRGAAAGWAGRRDLRALRLRRGDGARLVVGTSGASRLALRDRHSLLVVGPAHTGKTAGIAIPALLEWSGPAVVASSGSELIGRTIGWRSREGDTHVYDPAAVVPYVRSRWSPLAGCATWPGAIRAAHDLVAGAMAAAGASLDGGDLTGRGRGEVWRSSMATALAPYLLAAVVARRPVRELVAWLERDERDEVLEVLRGVDRAAAHFHETEHTRPDTERSSFLRVMHRVLSVYEDPTVASSMDREEIVAAELLDGGSHTLYVTVPEHDQARYRPLGATIIRQVIAAAYERTAAGDRLDPPLLLLLDDVVGMGPVDDLAALAAGGATRGVQVVSVFRDLGHVEDHYGTQARLLVRNHAARLEVPGRRDPGADPGDGLLPSGLAAGLGDGEGALLYGSIAPARVKLRPWFRDRDLRRKAAATRQAVAPVLEPDAPDASYRPPDQATAWLRRRGARHLPVPAPVPTIPVDVGSHEETFGSVGDSADRHPMLDGGNVTDLSRVRDRFRRR